MSLKEAAQYMYMYVEINISLIFVHLLLPWYVQQCIHVTVYRGQREGGEPRSDDPSTGEPVASSTTGRVEGDTPGDIETTPPETGVTADSTPRVPKLMSSRPKLRSRVPKHIRSILREGNKLYNYMQCTLLCGQIKGTARWYMYPLYVQCWPGLFSPGRMATSIMKGMSRCRYYLNNVIGGFNVWYRDHYTCTCVSGLPCYIFLMCLLAGPHIHYFFM